MIKLFTITFIIAICSTNCFGYIGSIYGVFEKSFGEPNKISYSNQYKPNNTENWNQQHIRKATFINTDSNGNSYQFNASFDEKLICYYLVISRVNSKITTDDINLLEKSYGLTNSKVIKKETYKKLYYQWMGFTNDGSDFWRYKTVKITDEEQERRVYWNDMIGMVWLPNKSDCTELWLINHNWEHIPKFNILIK